MSQLLMVMLYIMICSFDTKEYIGLKDEHPAFANGQFLFGTSERLRSLQCRIVWEGVKKSV